MNNIILVFLGGGLGSVVRYGISELVKLNFKTVFPLATFFSNLISCIILAIVIALFNEKIGINTTLKTFLVVGFCGGFSTFSTFSFETLELMRSGNLTIAIFNIIISIATCIAIIYFLTKSI